MPAELVILLIFFGIVGSGLFYFFHILDSEEFLPLIIHTTLTIITCGLIFWLLLGWNLDTINLGYYNIETWKEDEITFQTVKYRSDNKIEIINISEGTKDVAPNDALVHLWKNEINKCGLRWDGPDYNKVNVEIIKSGDIRYNELKKQVKR